jgi:hypothetical protein
MHGGIAAGARESRRKLRNGDVVDDSADAGYFAASWTAVRRAVRVGRWPESVTTPSRVSTSIPVRLSDNRFFFT